MPIQGSGPLYAYPPQSNNLTYRGSSSLYPPSTTTAQPLPLALPIDSDLMRVEQSRLEATTAFAIADQSHPIHSRLAGLSEIFAEYNIPVGMINQLMGLNEFEELVFH